MKTSDEKLSLFVMIPLAIVGILLAGAMLVYAYMAITLLYFAIGSMIFYVLKNPLILIVVIPTVVVVVWAGCLIDSISET
jgi:hypothetical protein